MNVGYRDFCHPLFKKLNILPLYSQYIFSLSTYEVKNTCFQIKFCNKQCWYQTRLWLISSDNKYEKSTKWEYYSGITIFNNLTLDIMKLFHDTNKFKLAWKKFLLAGSFYSFNEYLQWNLMSCLGTY